jgi:hypothetical protein
MGLPPPANPTIGKKTGITNQNSLQSKFTRERRDLASSNSVYSLGWSSEPDGNFFDMHFRNG